ncbi:MAG: TetR/AcrR family transcriptional regulator [Bacillota bacterium]
MAVKSGDKFAAILDAAQQVIAEQGYHNAQISRIAREAGVAAGTVYLYFKNKPDLLVCLFRERLKMLIEESREAMVGVEDPREKLRLAIQQHFRSLGRRRELAVVTQIEMRQADTSVQQQISELMKGWFHAIDVIIAEGRAAGLFTRQVPAKQIRNMIFGTLDQTVTAWVLSGFKFDLEALAEPTYQLISHGVIDNGQEQGGLREHGNSGASKANV